ncbi:hypothetical protein ACMZ5F_08810 [Streptomyces rhizosphaericola]|uniref:hypothetical protein n=1 Tax=Streptomyces rhizosphaericola TaxID=2564098 RepID=UPI0039F0FBCA
MPSSKSDVKPGAQPTTAGLPLSDRGDHQLTTSSTGTPEDPGHHPPHSGPRCARRRRIPVDLAREGAGRSAVTRIDRAVRCQLSAHDEGEHFGLLADTGTYGTALWLRWHGPDEARLVVLPDCPATAPGPDGDGCRLFAGHTAHHTWQDGMEQTPERS